MLIKKHLFLVSMILMLLSAWFTVRSVLQDGVRMQLQLISEQGDASLLSAVTISGALTDQNIAGNRYVQSLTLSGHPLAISSVTQQPLSARQAAYLPHMRFSGMTSYAGRQHTYKLQSGSMIIRGSVDLLTLQRYTHDYRETTALQVPVKARIPGRPYNAWEFGASLVTSPVVETDDATYLLIPVDSRSRGASTLYRLEQWAPWPVNKDSDAVLADDGNTYTTLADIPLEAGMSLCGLFAFEDELLVIGSISTTESQEQGASYEQGSELLVLRYNTAGHLLSSDRFPATFHRIQNAALEGDTLTLVTSGAALTAHVFSLQENTSLWGQIDLSYDRNVEAYTYLPFSFCLVENRLYHAAAIAQHPVIQEDNWTLLYADGTVVEGLWHRWRRPIQRNALYVTVYDASGSTLYSGYFDPGLNQDLAWRKSTEQQVTLPERSLIRLEIWPAGVEGARYD